MYLYSIGRRSSVELPITWELITPEAIVKIPTHINVLCIFLFVFLLTNKYYSYKLNEIVKALGNLSISSCVVCYVSFFDELFVSMTYMRYI